MRSLKRCKNGAVTALIPGMAALLIGLVGACASGAHAGAGEASGPSSVQAPSAQADAARIMENLGRGVVAVRTGSSSVFVSWRSLALDSADTHFNVYRSRNGSTPVKRNSNLLTRGTNFSDNNAPDSASYDFTVRPVIGGVERAASAAFRLAANGPAHPVVRVPLSAPPGPGYYTKFAWVGDLDGDGEYDFVIDRQAPAVPNTNGDLGAGPQYLEAYKRDGTPLWRLDLGEGSRNIYNVTPGPATIGVGMYDGVTVADLDSDGRAEVVIRIASGVTFPDGTVFAKTDPKQQYLAILDGMTGQPYATRALPDNYYAKASTMGAQLGIGSLDGVTPTIYYWGRNRNSDKSFNDIFATFSWSGGSTITEHWRLPLHQATYAGGNPTGNLQEASHQMRIIDVDGDGKDELATGNFLVNTDGKIRYILPGVSHGDRFFIGKFDPNHPGMRGYGVQQTNPSGLIEYYYDATNGEVLWTHNVAPANTYDNGRGIVGDIDPRFPGFEVFSLKMGVYNGETNAKTVTAAQDPNGDRQPWPHQMLWWDGDVLTELLNEYKLEKWDWLAPTTSRYLPRLVTLNDPVYETTIGADSPSGKNPVLMGDIIGDWRTEMVVMSPAQDELVIFTTNVPSSTRLYTMAQNPAYRNHMTIKGYVQSGLPDYFLGTGMSAPPRPNIRYAGDGADAIR